METKVINGYSFIRYNPTTLSPEEISERSSLFYNELNARRSVRDFSDKAVSREVIDTLIRTASTAPSGAHKQPWTFCVVSNPEIKKQIRIEAEKEE
ncbi:MAG TPA: nitroreductase family protein, partial [Chryseolinea sp.]|nr:nitroreductase family protein [Chryseolinea sp.]